MREVGSGPNRKVDEFAMGSPYFGAQVDVDLGRTVFLTVDDIGVKRSSDGGSGFWIITHLVDIVVHVATAIESQQTLRTIACDVHA